nr:TPA_asm: hypothetical protein HUJ06_000432 [Nelumbo nucifera]
MMKPHVCEPNSVSSALAMHRDSYVVSKFKPKIRIIHIFAPEIIQTDAANFRELVQRLTGKPTDRRGRKKKSRFIAAGQESTKAITELTDGFNNSGYGYAEGRIIKEEEMWRCENSTTDYLGGFDFDSFIKGFDDSEMDGFGEAHLSSSLLEMI